MKKKTQKEKSELPNSREAMEMLWNIADILSDDQVRKNSACDLGKSFLAVRLLTSEST